jgi:DNA replication protein DnaC
MACFTGGVSDELEQIADLNPHMRPAGGLAYSCPYGVCNGDGWVLHEDRNEARPCRCRAARVAKARSSSLNRVIPKRYQGVAFDRAPVSQMDPHLVRVVRRYCQRIDEKLDAGEGIGFHGDVGTGKSSLTYLISQHALRAHRSVAIYTLPQLLSEIRKTYEDSASQSYTGLIERLTQVDLLQLEELAVDRRTSEWVLEQLYTVVNGRYDNERAIVYTADVQSPEQLADHVGARTASRLSEMCGEPIPVFGRDQRVEAGRRLRVERVTETE